MSIHIIPTLSDNYSYVLKYKNEAIIIDCGEATPVIGFLKNRNLHPASLLCTHHHPDHVDGIPELLSAFPDLKIYIPSADRSRIPFAQYFFKDNDSLSLNGLEILCLETKGHTKNHICFYIPELQALFSGDTLFSMGCGRLLEGTAEEMFHSLQNLKQLPDDTMVYCGHEYTLHNALFCLSQDKDNPDLQRRIEDVKTLREKGQPTLPVSLETEKKTNIFLKAQTLEDFTQLRKLRDNF